MKNKLRIIYYHEVVQKKCGYSYQKIDINKFNMQMKYLQDHGYQTIWFSELRAELPEKTVIVSFDDGFRSVYENAAPIMKKYGIKGNVYLPTAYIGEKPQFMTWEMVKELEGDFEFQAHTHNHTDIRALSAEDLEREISKSDDCFRTHGLPLPNAFCMPFGTFDRQSIKAMKAIGRYCFLLGSCYGRVYTARVNKVLPRIGISNDDSLEVFAGKLNGKLDWKGPLQRLRLELRNLKKERITEYKYD